MRAGARAARPGAEYAFERKYRVGASAYAEERAEASRLRSRECAALEVAYGLLDFLACVHDERTVLHDGLA